MQSDWRCSFYYLSVSGQAKHNTLKFSLKKMSRLNKIRNAIIKVWKDPVWSKVISAGIILLIATIWTKYSNYSSQQVFDFFILVITYKLPIFAFLSLLGLYFLTNVLITLFRKKPDPIWDEQVGNYKFKELYQILSSQNLPIGTVGMSFSGRKPPDNDLLTLFHVYSGYFNKGIDLNSNVGDGGYLYGVLAPKLLGYGLLDKIESKNLKIDVIDTKYQTSEVGYKFYALLEKSIHLLPNKKARTANRV
jgi:hypothetical protein